MIHIDDMDELVHGSIKKTKGKKSDKKKKQVNDESLVQKETDNIGHVNITFDDTSELQNAFISLEQKYNDLKNIGIMEAEKRFDEFKAASDAQIKDYALMVQRLEDKVKFLEKSRESTITAEQMDLEIAAVKEQGKAILKEKLLAAESHWNDEKASLVEMLNESVANNENLLQEIQSLKAEKVDGISKGSFEETGLINFYKDLSGLSILFLEKDSSVENMMMYTCLQSGKKGDLLFQIRAPVVIDESSSSVEYIPCLDKDFNGFKTSADILESLPPYLMEEIEFDKSMLSSFFLRILTYLKS